MYRYIQSNFRKEFSLKLLTLVLQPSHTSLCINLMCANCSYACNALSVLHAKLMFSNTVTGEYIVFFYSLAFSMTETVSQHIDSVK